MILRTNNIAELAQILCHDGVIAVPTDTVYGLCARIDSIKAYNHLVTAKERLFSKPFPIMCLDRTQIGNIAILDRRAERLIQHFMPGPITLVLPARADLPQYINNGKTSVAVRLASSPEIAELIRRVGSPLFMTSANRGGEPVCATPAAIARTCPLIDGIYVGALAPKLGISSTIVDCTAEECKILREGPISLEQILRATTP